MQEQGPVSEEQFAQAMKDVDFSNFMVCSATKTSEDSKLITFGYLKKTKVMNDKWLKDTVQKLQARQGTERPAMADAPRRLQFASDNYAGICHETAR